MKTVTTDSGHLGGPYGQHQLWRSLASLHTRSSAGLLHLHVKHLKHWIADCMWSYSKD